MELGDLPSRVTVGMEALDLFELIFRHYDLRRAEVVKYKCEEKPHFDEVKKKDPTAKRSVKSALQHTSDFCEPSIILCDEYDFAKVRREMANLKEIDPRNEKIASYMKDAGEGIIIHEALKAVSRVRTTDGDCHIPFLDLDIPVEESGPASIREVIEALNEIKFNDEKKIHLRAGAVLDSGKSYHFWGLELIPDHEWQEFLQRVLLLDRIDRRWVGHRLIDKQANLRISQKRGKVPKVVQVFDLR